MTCVRTDLPPHLHYGGADRCIEDVTGKVLDGRPPAYVSPEAQATADIIAHIDQVIEAKRARAEELARKHSTPKPPIPPHVYEALGVKPPELRR